MKKAKVALYYVSGFVLFLILLHMKSQYKINDLPLKSNTTCCQGESSNKSIVDGRFIRDMVDASPTEDTRTKPEKQSFLSNNDTQKNFPLEDENAQNFCSNDFKLWLQRNDRYTNKAEVEAFQKSNCSQTRHSYCKNGQLVGPLPVRTENKTFVWLYMNELQFVKKGGWWRPDRCMETQQTAIIIPFRDRDEHLAILLRQLHPILFRNNLHYRIFVIEQTDNSSFNRAKLMNVGYKEARKYFPYPCVVFHDVDLIPENDGINYTCTKSPTHLSAAVDKFHYKLLYKGLFGGIEMFRAVDYEAIDGSSNSFWKWGGEDDNLYVRCTTNGFKIHRQSMDIARYTMLKHSDNAVDGSKKERQKMLSESRQHLKHDGLSNLQYHVIQQIEYELYTLIKVDLRKERDKLFGVKEFSTMK